MTKEEQGKSLQAWTGAQVYISALVCLLGFAPVGFAVCSVGYLLRETESTPEKVVPASVATTQQRTMQPADMRTRQQLTPEQMKAMADKQAAPMIEQLTSNPRNAALAAQIGDLYYDAQVFSSAIEYYRKSLAVDPKNSAVRTDMATALFDTKATDSALAELNRILQNDPLNNAALFNRGIVKWQGRKDVNGAVADWESILRQNPNYAQADEVRGLIAQATESTSISPGQATGTP